MVQLVFGGAVEVAVAAPMVCCVWVIRSAGLQLLLLMCGGRL